jgi:hypothetical protein
MRAPTLLELRRVLAGALLASCAPPAPPAPPPLRPPPTPIPDAAPADARARVPDAGPPPDAMIRKKRCAHGHPDVNSCAGAKVTLDDPPAVCGLPDDAELSASDCAYYCAGFDTRSCSTYYGRPTSAGVPAPPAHPHPLIARLRRARQLETESIAAFHELRRDLARFGAPARLLAACRRAARDEARHAAAFTRLIRARGVTPPRLHRRPARGFASLAALAHHNERHGVVGETLGALDALHQSLHGPVELRATMRPIAADELRHAHLSFQISAWAQPRISGLLATRRAAAPPALAHLF